MKPKKSTSKNISTKKDITKKSNPKEKPLYCKTCNSDPFTKLQRASNFEGTIEEFHKNQGHKVVIYKEKQSIEEEFTKTAKKVIPNQKQLKKLLSKQKEEPYILSNLTEIEDPNIMGKPVCVSAIVASNTISYSVPTKINVKCYNDGDNHFCASVKTIEIIDIDKVGFTEINETARSARCKAIAKNNGFTKGCNLTVEELELSTIKKVRVRPIVSILESNNGKLADINGNEWKAYDIYIKENKLKSYEAGKEIQITGYVIAEPKNQRISLIASQAQKTDDYSPDVTKIKQLSKFVKKKSIKDTCDWITLEFSKYSKIVKRENVTLAALLTFFSPVYFDFEDKHVNGWIKITIIGDSTTGKSQTVSQMIALLQNGQMVSGETATTQGLGAAATQSPNSQWFVEYGPLVLQDLKLLAIDGAHKLTREHWASLAEAERTGKLIITKAAKGEAHARTRQIKIMNPVSDDYKTTRPMKSFFHVSQSIENSLQIQNIARQDLVIFVSDNVNSKFINVRNGHAHDDKLEYYRELLKLVWNQQYEIIIEDSAYEEILLQATNLEKRFKCEEIPLITNDQKYKLAKLSIALASVTLSFDKKFTKLTVTKEHVKFVSEFIETEYHNAGLDIVAEQLNDSVDSEIIGETIYEIKKALEKRENADNEFCKSIILWSAQQTKFTRSQLMTEFELSENHELRPLLSKMQSLKLVNQKQGYIPTKKLIEIGKEIQSEKLQRGVSSLPLDKLDNLDRKTQVNNDLPHKSDNSSQSVSSLSRLSTLTGDTPLRNSEITNFTKNHTIITNLAQTKANLEKSSYTIRNNGTVKCNFCKSSMDIPSAIRHTCQKRENQVGDLS